MLGEFRIVVKTRKKSIDMDSVGEVCFGIKVLVEDALAEKKFECKEVYFVEEGNL